MKCTCGLPLTAWDIERRLNECVRCALAKAGALPSPPVA
jgi:hypothetical protein